MGFSTKKNSAPAVVEPTKQPVVAESKAPVQTAERKPFVPKAPEFHAKVKDESGKWVKIGSMFKGTDGFSDTITLDEGVEIVSTKEDRVKIVLFPNDGKFK